MEKRYHLLWNVLPVIALILWGALGITENLWYDEAYSAALVTHSFREIIDITAQDVHSPFYYFLLKGVWEIFGSIMGFRCLKWFSILAMMGYLLLGKFYVKKLFGETVSVYFMLFSITLPIMMVQSSNVRMYTLALFFLTLTGLLMVDILRESTLRKWLLFIFASVCCVYSHTYAMLEAFFLYIFFFAVILYQKKYKLLKCYFVSGITVSALFLPWLSVTFGQLKNRSGGTLFGLGVRRLVVGIFLDGCKEWFTALETPIMPVMWAEVILCLFLCFHAVRWMRARHNYAPALGMLAIMLAIAAGEVIFVFTRQGFFGRYFFPGFASLVLMYAVGMEQLRSKLIKGLVVFVSVVCLSAQYRSELELEYGSEVDVWKNYVEENVAQEDVIMAAGVHCLYLNIYCPEKSCMIYGYLPEFLPFQRTEAFTRSEQLEDLDGTLWYLCGMDSTPYLLSERYTWEEVLCFHHMYQDFSFFKLTAVAQ